MGEAARKIRILPAIQAEPRASISWGKSRGSGSQRQRPPSDGPCSQVFGWPGYRIVGQGRWMGQRFALRARRPSLQGSRSKPASTRATAISSLRRGQLGVAGKSCPITVDGRCGVPQRQPDNYFVDNNGTPRKPSARPAAPKSPSGASPALPAEKRHQKKGRRGGANVAG